MTDASPSPVPALRVVVDTNVIIAALLTPDRTPDLALRRLVARGGRLVVDARILAEYRAVVVRPKFAAVPADRRDALLALLVGASDAAHPAPFETPMTDGDDRMFVEVALGGGADAIVTGNGRHFPVGLPVAVWSPAELLARLGD